MPTDSSQIVKAVKKVLPGVVSITMSKDLSFVESPFGFLGPGFPAGPIVPHRKKVKMGGGSGFVVDSSGIILTNRHVVEDPTAEYVVVLQSGEKLTPKILARDPINDIAILKIDPSVCSGREKTGLAIIELGNSSGLELGESVVAIGHALGLFHNTVSTGVVSGLSREIKAQSDITQERTRLRGLIQTDAAINPGNSGGPLINLAGKAIGINAAMVFGAENIGFALPINNAKKDLDDLREFGRLRQPFLGIRYIPISKGLQQRFNLPVDTGALVIAEPDTQSGIQQAVVPGSPAEKAGIREADIVLEVEKERITEEQGLDELLSKLKVGQKIGLKILRENKEKVLKTILAER